VTNRRAVEARWVLIDGVSLGRTVVLVDTNVIIEAVRTQTWNALTGGLRVETVEECRQEAGRGDTSRWGYIPVSNSDLARLHRVHTVTDEERAEYFDADPDGVGLDAGERDLFAHIHQRVQRGNSVWVLCSADKAAIRTAVRIDVADQMVSLEAVCRDVGARPRPGFDEHHCEAFLARYRTEYRLNS
jgi:hypothetical protein